MTFLIVALNQGQYLYIGDRAYISCTSHGINTVDNFHWKLNGSIYNETISNISTSYNPYGSSLIGILFLNFIIIQILLVKLVILTAQYLQVIKLQYYFKVYYKNILVLLLKFWQCMYICVYVCLYVGMYACDIINVHMCRSSLGIHLWESWATSNGYNFYMRRNSEWEGNGVIRKLLCKMLDYRWL